MNLRGKILAHIPILKYNLHKRKILWKLLYKRVEYLSLLYKDLMLKIYERDRLMFQIEKSWNWQVKFIVIKNKFGIFPQCVI